MLHHEHHITEMTLQIEAEDCPRNSIGNQPTRMSILGIKKAINIKFEESWYQT